MATKKGMSDLGKLYARATGKELTAEGFASWAYVLAPISDELLPAAFTRALRTNEQYIFGPGQVFQAAIQIMKSSMGSPLAAFETARKAAVFLIYGDNEPESKDGYWDTLPPDIKEVAHNLGAHCLADFRTTDFATRAQFLHEYNLVAQRGLERAMGLLPPAKVPQMLPTADAGQIAAGADGGK